MKENKHLQDETLTNKLIKNGFWIYFFTFFIAPSGYIIRVIISNDLGVEQVGIIYSIISFMGLISTYNDLGLTESLNYFLPKFWINEKYNNFKNSLFVSVFGQMITGLILAGGIFRGADWLAINYFHTPSITPLIQFFCWYFLLNNLYQILTTFFKAFQDSLYYKLLDFIKMMSIMGLSVYYFWAGTGSTFNYGKSWIIGLGLTTVVGLIVFAVKYRDTINRGKVDLNKDFLSKYSKYAMWAFIGMNFARLMGQIDQQMIIYLLGPESAGYYSNYLSLLKIATLVTGPLLGFLYPIVSELFNKNQHWKLKLLINFFYKYFGLFAISLSGLFVALGPQIAYILFGTDFINSGYLLMLGGSLLIVQILYVINFNILAGSGKIRKRVKIIATACIINIVCNLFLINTIGISGAVIATMISRTVMFIASHKLVNRMETINFDWKYFFKNLAIIVGLSSLIYAFKNKIFIANNIYRYKNLIYLCSIGIGYYILLMIANYKEFGMLKKQIQNFRNR